MLSKTIVISTLLLLSMVAYASPVEYVPGEVIVRLKKTASVSSYAGISDVKHSEFKVMKVDKNKDIYAAINELALNPDVEFAEPNYIFHISTTPNIKLWALKNTGQAISHTPGVTGEWIYPSDTSTSGTSGDDIDAVSAWSIFNDCSSIIVAIIDTGVKYDHSDFIGNMWDGLPTYPNHGYNFIANEDHNNPTTSNNPMDTCGHGTHVAGIIGASGTVSGVCGNVKLMAVKSFGSDGAASSATIVSGIGFAIDNGANIINASFNIYSYSAALSTEIAAAKSAGILFVAAAGNGLNDDGNGYNVDTGTQTYPCGFTQDNVLCVAALDQNFDLASFSNYGATSVDVAAPGTNIYSTWCTSPTCLNSTGCGCGGGNHGICAAASPYAIENGTSMATPYAAGLAALVWANNPSFTYLDVKNAVMYGGTAVSSMSGKSVSGNVINAVSALAYINSPTGLAAKVQ